MGCCFGASLDENTRNINAHLQEDERDTELYHKLLFLGSGGSGKSTIFKQLQWLHGDGFSKQDAESLREHIYCQVIKQMQEAIESYLSNDDTNDTKMDEKLVSAIKDVKQYSDPMIFSASIASSVQYIWQNDKRLQGIFTKYFQNKVLDETTEYFWNEIDRIKCDDYTPTQEDIINVRYRTTGVTEKKFEIDSIKFHIFDVGGQKSERKKWINCFDGVDAVVFVASLSCYNELMYEDQTKNCMVDSLELFEEIANTKCFIETPIILFLNKTDLYQQKITEIAITESSAFTDYDKNANDYNETTEYIKDKFLSLNHQERTVYVHFTCAMDRKNVENVFNDVTSMIIKQVRSNLDMM